MIGMDILKEIRTKKSEYKEGRDYNFSYENNGSKHVYTIISPQLQKVLRTIAGFSSEISPEFIHGCEERQDYSNGSYFSYTPHEQKDIFIWKINPQNEPKKKETNQHSVQVEILPKKPSLILKKV